MNLRSLSLFRWNDFFSAVVAGTPTLPLALSFAVEGEEYHADVYDRA